MTVNLTPEIEQLLDERIARGEFESREALLAHALELLAREKDVRARPSGEECANQLEAFFAEIDSQPPSEAGPLSDDALSRETFYDTQRTRV